MLLSKLLERIRPTCPYRDVEVTAVTDRTADIIPGCVFVCIRGAHFDGHTAAAGAVERGAAAIVAEYDTGVQNQILVPNTREAYGLLCQAFYDYPAEKLAMVGITGTNGKTTTAFLIKDILDTCGKRAGLIGTVQNMVGDQTYPAQLTTPDALELNRLLAEMVDAGCTHCVMEVSSQALAQGRVNGIRFAVAGFTNLTQDHLDYHRTFEAYCAAKHKLFQQADTAVINMDDASANVMVAGTSCKVLTISAHSDSADYTAKNIIYRPHNVSYELVTDRHIGRVKIGIPGTFTVYNSMLAAVCCMALGIDFQQAVEALHTARGIPGRIEVVPTGTDYTVIIDYAHSPDGLRNILESLREICGGGRILTVFGCGGDRDKTKRPQMGRIAQELSDVCIVTSDNPRSEDPDAIIRDILAGMERDDAHVVVEPDRTAAIGRALSLARAGDIVLLAGKGHETYQILNTGKIHFDEREKIREILKIQS